MGSGVRGRKLGGGHASRGAGEQVRAGRKRNQEDGAKAEGNHAGERPHKCSTCGKAFSWASNLAVHMRVHSGERPCEGSTCGKAFAQSGDLVKRTRVHSGERPYEWPKCRHMRMHSGERPGL